MKPNFHTVSRAELLAYLKEHRDDNEAWGIFLDRRDKDAKQYPAPLDEEGMRVMEEAFQRKLNGEL